MKKFAHLTRIIEKKCFRLPENSYEDSRVRVESRKSGRRFLVGYISLQQDHRALLI